MAGNECQQRYSTEIPTEYFYKYRKPAPKMSLYKTDDFDVFQKSVEGTKLGAFAGIAAAGIMFGDTHKTFILSEAVERSFRHGMPWLIAGTAYGVTTGIVAKIRNKDGPMNHFIGGATAGVMLGSWYKSPRIGTYAVVLLGGVASLFKYLSDINFGAPGGFRRSREFNMYRIGWFTERPNPEGEQDEAKDDRYLKYRP